MHRRSAGIGLWEQARRSHAHSLLGFRAVPMRASPLPSKEGGRGLAVKGNWVELGQLPDTLQATLP